MLTQALENRFTEDEFKKIFSMEVGTTTIFPDKIVRRISLTEFTCDYIRHININEFPFTQTESFGMIIKKDDSLNDWDE